LGSAEGNVYKDLNDVVERYKVVVHWWNPMRTLRKSTILYNKYLKRTQQWVVGIEGTNMSINMASIIWVWSPKVRWKGEILKINWKIFEAIKAQPEEVGWNGEGE
jgi:hypothetical protein